jgi:hypothetical protein
LPARTLFERAHPATIGNNHAATGPGAGLLFVDRAPSYICRRKDQLDAGWN